jgi:hypothetical protein
MSVIVKFETYLAIKLLLCCWILTGAWIRAPFDGEKIYLKHKITQHC